MLRNYFRIAFRVFSRNTGFSVLNVAGLAIGLTCFVLIALYVRHEVSHDSFVPESERVFRVAMNKTETGMQVPNIISDVSTMFKEHFPEFELSARVGRLTGSDVVLVRDGLRFNERELYVAEPAFLDIFGYELAIGDGATALTQPNSVLLTPEMAVKYFGDQDPLGQEILLYDSDGEENALTMTVTGVLEELPGPSHFTFDFLVSFSTLGPAGVLEGGKAYTGLGRTYVRLAPGTDAATLEAKVTRFFEQYEGDRILKMSLSSSELALQPIEDVYLYTDNPNEYQTMGDIQSIYLFSIVAGLILIIACVNYMNLATSRAVKRAREIGVRKVVGAARGQIMRQMLVESVLFAALALLIAVVLVEALLPFFSNFVGKSLSFDASELALWLVAIAAFVGVVSGVYPALFLSGFTPVSVLKGGGGQVRRESALWRYLVVFQFGISIFLIAATFVVRDQLSYMNSKDVGYDKEHVVSVLMWDDHLFDNREAFRERLEQIPGVQSAAASSATPVDMKFGSAEETEIEGRTISMNPLFIDYGTLETLGIDIVEGRDFSRDFPADLETGVLINESFARAMNWTEPLGKTVKSIFGGERTVIGVTADFHFDTLYENIEPAIMQYYEDFLNMMLVRIGPGTATSTLAAMEEVWNEFVPYRPFEYSFLDQDFDAKYRAEQKLASLFGLFSTLAVLIACLGIVGLAAYIAERRTKEIGIRKVFGASVRGVIALMTGGFVRLIVVAFVIAAPLAWLAADRWLDRFAYRIEPGPVLFLTAGGIVLGIALLSVAWQAVRAATSDPVKSLRYE